MRKPPAAGGVRPGSEFKMPRAGTSGKAIVTALRFAVLIHFCYFVALRLDYLDFVLDRGST